MHEKNISEDRKKYLRKIKQGKAAVIITQLLILIIFIISWEILANQGIIDSFITSQPSRIFDTFLNLSSNGLLRHLGITLTETLIGFISGVLLGVAIAICLWWSTFLSKVSEPYLVILNSLPKVALRSCHYNLGRSAECGAIITMGLAISLIVTVLEILNGFLNTDKELMKMAKTFGASKFQLLTKIVIPANINTFFNSLRSEERRVGKEC